MSVKVLAFLTMMGFGFVFGLHIRDANEVCNTDVCRELADTLLGSIDANVDPCTDFYGHACGNYIRAHPVQGGKTFYGTFQEATDRVQQQMKDILENDIDASIPEMDKAKRMYQACLNASDDIDAIKEEIRNFGGAPLFTGSPWNSDLFNVLDNLKFLYHIGLSPMISVAVSYDKKVPLTNVIQIDAGDLLISEASFNNNEPGTPQYKYKEFIRNVTDALKPCRQTDRDAMIDEMVAFEGRLAKLTLTPLEMQNSTALYNRLSIDELQVLSDPYKEFVDWVDFLKSIVGVDDITGDEPVILSNIENTVRAVKLLMESDKRTIANYLTWRFLYFAAGESFGTLSKLYANYLASLIGTSDTSKRYTKCITVVEKTFGQVIGRAYVGKFFSQADKLKADEMLETIQNAFIERLQNVKFMDEATKEIAADKARSITRLVGFPDWIMNDTALLDYYKLYPNMTKSHFLNVFEAAIVSFTTLFKELRVPIDRESFLTPPTSINAFYLPPANSITIPAAILQPPFYQAGLPDANNFGAIGAVLGHEITHGFDNDGSKYDKYGALKDWWPESVVENFEALTQCFVEQYKSYCQGELLEGNPNVTICVNGETTLGENIADNGGLGESYQAWKSYFAKNGHGYKLPGIGNITSEQIFFLSYANIYCQSYTPIGYITQVLTDSHSPENFRVIGALANSPDFAEAFNCPVGPMNRGNERCTIW